MRGVRAHRHQRAFRSCPQRLPQLRPPSPHHRPRIHRPAGGRRLVARAGRPAALGRSPQVRELPGAPGAGEKKGRGPGRPALGLRPVGRHAGGPRRDGFQLHGRVDGLGGGREDRAPDPALGGEEDPADHRLGVRGRPHAGGGAVADADGEDVGRDRPAEPGGRAVHFDPDQSDHGRCLGLLRNAGGCDPRRAWRGGGLRRAAGDQADDRPGPPRRLPDGRVPGRARHGGRRRAPERATGQHRTAAASHGGSPAGGGRRLSQGSFEDACRFLFARQAARIKWGLGPTQALLDVLGHPERRFPSIHVGGSNGKGSTCALIGSALGARGHRVGVYTSPHLVSVRERMVVDGVPIDADAFAEWTTFLRPHIERLDASFFEATTAIAFADLAARGVDVGVIEVGLGGRLDATNVITPLVSVVTKIAREHTEYLGDDLASIAREKAGIAKPGVPFVTGERDPAVANVLVAEAKRAGASPVTVVDTARSAGGPLGLLGAHQQANAWVAVAALDALSPPFGSPRPGVWPASFADAYVPGRFEVRGRWIFDVAHNPDGARVLADTLRQVAPPRPRHALVGVLGDKDYVGMIAILAEAIDQFVFATPRSAPPQRRWSLERLEQELEGSRIAATFEPDFDRALERVQEQAETIGVTGSVHTVGDACARLPGFAAVG